MFLISNNSLKRPWNTQIELTFGCDNRCPMCYKQVLDKPKDSFEFMKLSTARVISGKMRDAGWNGIRLEFAMRGEPLLNPYFFRIIKVFREAMPDSQIMVTTNGNHLTPDKVKQYFRAGGNIFLVDCYHNDLEERKVLFKDFRVVDYYDDDFNPYYRNDVKRTHVVCLVDSIVKRTGESKTRVLMNMGGNVDFKRVKHFGLTPLSEPYCKKCVKPFREIIFMFDGSIPLCCEDAGQEYVLGSIHGIGDLGKFWRYNRKLNIARALLFNKVRNNRPCRFCDFKGGMRIGLIPPMKVLSKEQVEYYKEVQDKML